LEISSDAPRPASTHDEWTAARRRRHRHFLLAPVPALFGILLIVAAFATREFYALLPAANIPRYPIVGTFCGLLYLVAVWAQLAIPSLTSTQRSAIEPAMFFLIVSTILIRQFPQKENPRPLETMAGTLMACSMFRSCSASIPASCSPGVRPAVVGSSFIVYSS